jgi:RNA polymerase sigma factor (sigma-70 family)
MGSIAAFEHVREPGVDELEAIFQEHNQLVYRTAYGVTGSAQEAEDVLQTVFLQLLRSGVPPGLRKNPKGYLYRAAVNQALNAVRSRRRRAEVFDPATLERAIDTLHGNREQLGLQLEAVQAPLAHVVIDRIERPSPN